MSSYIRNAYACGTQGYSPLRSTAVIQHHWTTVPSLQRVATTGHRGAITGQHKINMICIWMQHIFNTTTSLKSTLDYSPFASTTTSSCLAQGHINTKHRKHHNIIINQIIPNWNIHHIIIKFIIHHKDKSTSHTSLQTPPKTDL